MDIGTAKPSAAERAAVPHHLIDLIEPPQSYSAARFVADAHAADRRRSARAARLPLLVGGTMLYFKALFDGLDAMPRAPTRRCARRCAERAAREGWPALHAELARGRSGHARRAWRRTTRSASSARSRSGRPAAGRCRAFTAAASAARHRRRMTPR